MKKFLFCLTILIASLSLNSCTSDKNFDKGASLSKNDYKDLLNHEKKTKKALPKIPKLEPVVAPPSPPMLEDTRRISVSITAKDDLKDVLYQIARQSNIDLELDPRIKGGLYFSAYNRPIKEVIERLANSAGLRYNFENNHLRIELDEPFLKNYKIDALNLVRSSKSDVSAATDVFQAVDGGEYSGQTGNNSSTSEISSQNKSDFWQEIKENITSILKTRPNNNLITSSDKAYETIESKTADRLNEMVDKAENMGEQRQQKAKEIQQADKSQPKTKNNEKDKENKDYFTINKQAGLISVFTTSKQHEKINQYIKQIKSLIGSQVLIEAKIVEVTLDDEYKSGVNWNKLGGSDDFRISAPFSKYIPFPSGETSPSTFTISSHVDGEVPFDFFVEFLNSFGAVRTLSSPRLTVMNNHSAILKVAENEVYFTLDIDREDLENGTTRTTITSNLNTVPIGIIMNVQPSINTDTGKVTMSLRPTISRVAKRVADPGVALTAADLNVDVESTIPVVEVREMDSVITVDDGQILVLGGLMQERVTNTDSSVPKASDIPVIGNAFKSKSKKSELTELIIFLKTTIVQGNNSVSKADKNIYQKYTPDSRPIAF